MAHKFLFNNSLKQEEGVFSRREDERKSFPIEFNKIQQEVLSNELAFARIVENDLRLREELETTTIMLEKQFDLLGSLCENLIGEKMYLNEEYRILKNQLNLALTPKSINHKSSQTSEDVYQKKITSNEPQFNDITTSSTHVKNFPLGNKLESSSTIVKSNETLLELMILDLDIRSKNLKK